ncbi:MAG TPA: cell division protein FtsZ [Candidatus Nanoarchaeia archaeon]|nr:cell division protein FtsZ [Candidatus Nanoarchaeia archaeon]
MLNVLIIGVGQCGNRILDAINKEAFGGGRFSKYYSSQKFASRVETIAINTAINDLKEMRNTKAKDRIHIPNLHGLGANRILGKKCFNDNKDLIMRNISERGDFDVAFVISSSSGGTGSSFSPPLVKELKEIYDFPVYSIMVLPFREEGTIYLQNSAFSIKEMRQSGSDGMILADNQYLKNAGSNIQSAYDGINKMIAERILFLLEALDSEMMLVTDLGDFKTVMSGGDGIATIGYAKGDAKTPIRTTIRESISPNGLLFSSNVYEEASRAMIILRGDQKYLSIDDISAEIDKLSSHIGHVFKGVIIRNGETPKVLSVLTLESTVELEKLYALAVEAIHIEKDKRKRVALQNETDTTFSMIDGLEPEY